MKSRRSGRKAGVARWILALSGSPSFVAAMQSTDLRLEGSRFR